MRVEAEGIAGFSAWPSTIPLTPETLPVVDVCGGNMNTEGAGSPMYYVFGRANVPDVEGVPDSEFPPLSKYLTDSVRRPEVLGVCPGDFQLFDCAASEEPLRQVPNTSDDWSYPSEDNAQGVRLSSVPTEFESSIGFFWKLLPFQPRQELVLLFDIKCQRIHIVFCGLDFRMLWK